MKKVLQTGKYMIPLLLIALVLICIGPTAVLEEFRPLKNTGVLVEYHNSWSTDTSDKRSYNTELMLASEVPFRLRLAKFQLVSEQPDGRPPFVDVGVPLGFRFGADLHNHHIGDRKKKFPQSPPTEEDVQSFVAKRQIVGHNYKLRLRFCVSDGGTIRIRSDPGKWTETNFFKTPERGRHWNLFDVEPHVPFVSRFLGFIGIGDFKFVFVSNQGQRPKYAGFTISKHFERQLER